MRTNLNEDRGFNLLDKGMKRKERLVGRNYLVTRQVRRYGRKLGRVIKQNEEEVI